MATDRIAGAALMMSLLAGGACSPIADRCRAGTLLVAVTVDGGASAADSFTVDISVDGGSAQEATLDHVPGQTAGNIEVQFPHGYPTSSVVTVTVTARAGGLIVGSGTSSPTLTSGCQATTLEITAVSAPSDGGGDDLPFPLDGGDDLATPPDLTTAPPDLTSPPPDMTCPGGGVELCFNGIDDDCDGHIDCDDPDCAPVAICEPTAPAGWTNITQESAAANCPSSTTSTTVYGNGDLTGGGCNSTCACSPGGCGATLTGEACDGTLSGDNRAVNNSSCLHIDDYMSFNVSAVSGTATCGGSGTASPKMPAVVPTTFDCAPNGTPLVGSAGGCAATQACVPVGTNECVYHAGGGVACPSGYPTAANWFTSFGDTRSCSCSCSTVGACSAAHVEIFDSHACNLDGTTGTPVSGLYCTNSVTGAKIINSGCAASAPLSGSLVFNAANERTVCCK